MLAVTLIGAELACHTGDVATCAYSATKDGFYQGRFLATGSNRVVNAYFGSLQDERATSLAVAPAGRFCIVWAHERVAEVSPLRHGEPLVRGPVQSVLLKNWRPTPPTRVPAGCQRSSVTIPWDRASDLTGSWRYLVLLGVPTAGLILALGRRLLPPRLRTPAVLMSTLSLVGSVVLSLALW